VTLRGGRWRRRSSEAEPHHEPEPGGAIPGRDGPIRPNRIACPVPEWFLGMGAGSPVSPEGVHGFDYGSKLEKA
jgi:hypothetical protein